MLEKSPQPQHLLTGLASAQRAPPGCFTQEGRSQWWAFGADIPLPEKRRSILRLPRAQVRGTQSFLLGHHQWKEFLHQEILEGAHPLTTYKCLVFSRSIHPSIQQNFLSITIACISLYHSCPQRYWWPDVVLPVDQPPTPNPTPALYPSGSPDLHTTSDSACTSRPPSAPRYPPLCRHPHFHPRKVIWGSVSSPPCLNPVSNLVTVPAPEILLLSKESDPRY